MTELYDSDKVRKASLAVRRVAEELSEGTAGPHRRAMQANETLEGKAAEAVQERLLELQDRTQKLNGELSSLARELERYAEILEETGERLEKAMQ